jgi:carboxypeptidase Taq
MTSALEQLRVHLATIRDLHDAVALLAWDQRTYMPLGGANTRAEQMATVSRIAHELFTSGTTGNLLESVNVADLPPDSDDARLIEVVGYDFERASKLPAEFVARQSRQRGLANPAWQHARAESDFALFQPHLEASIEMAREQAQLLGYSDHPYDALLNDYERGLTKDQVAALFEELKEGTLPLVRRIAAQGETGRDACMHGDFPEDQQEAFGKLVASHFGYDWSRGRQDRTAHPFCINFGRNDVRITTRFNPQWLAPALFGTLHETGHALYEQGVKPELSRTPLERGASLGIHESQSRMWENLVGRSRPFWQFFYPKLQQHFPERLGNVDLETFYRAINTVQPSFIRVEADEITYNLHILLRFELEVALIEGSLAVKDLPEAWNAKMQEYLGITPPNDALGVLQDIHWSGGMLGYFPTYTLGNVLSVQFFNHAVAQQPQIIDEMARGEFGTLLGWMRDNIHQHGRKFLPNELVKRVTGRPMDAAPYVQYLQAKFGELY